MSRTSGGQGPSAPCPSRPPGVNSRTQRAFRRRRVAFTVAPRATRRRSSAARPQRMKARAARPQRRSVLLRGCSVYKKPAARLAEARTTLQRRRQRVASGDPSGLRRRRATQAGRQAAAQSPAAVAAAANSARTRAFVMWASRRVRVAPLATRSHLRPRRSAPHGAAPARPLTRGGRARTA
jgi:hypothetical protein